jgi:colicin-like ribonuclease protein
VHNSSGQPTWRLGSNHSAQEWQKKLAQRGWTPQQINEAIQNGQRLAAVNNVNPGNAATRYVHPTTGRSVVVDNVTAEVIHVGGDGFVY